MHDDEIRRLLERDYAPPAPHAGAVDRIVERIRARRRVRVRAVSLALAAGLAAVAVWWVVRAPQLSSGQLTGGASAVAVDLTPRGTAEAAAGAELKWQIAADGAARVDQTKGSVRYRVRGQGGFVVHTALGRVTVTGTDFRVSLGAQSEDEAMDKRRKKMVVGALGVGAAAVVMVTVYEGRVLLSNDAGEVALAAGETATMTADRPPQRRRGTTGASENAAAPARDENDRARRITAPARQRLLRAIVAARLARLSPAPKESPTAAGSTDDEALAKPKPGRLSATYIQKTIREAIPLVRECYESARHDEPKLEGKLVVEMSIAGEEEAGGLVEDVELTGKSPVAKSAALGECVRETLLSLEFAKPEGGGRVSVRYPFIFSPKDPSAKKPAPLPERP